MDRRQGLVTLALAGAGLLSLGGAAQAAFPDKPIRLVVPYPPGGGGDTVARALAERLAEGLGQPVIVDNKPGASGIIGSAAAARSAPDGHTLLLATDHQMSVNPNLFTKMGFDPATDFVPIGQVVRFPFVLVVSPRVPARDLAGLLSHIRARPGQVNNATVGTASQPHLAAELLARQAGLKVVHIPFKGMAPALTDLIGGQVQMLFATVSAVEPMIKAGRLRAVAVSGAQRLALLPEVPTLAEAGVPGFDVTAWYGLYAPTGTPPAAINRLGRALRSAVTDADFVSRMKSQGLDARFTDGDGLSALMTSDRLRWGKVIQDMGIKPE